MAPESPQGAHKGVLELESAHAKMSRRPREVRPALLACARALPLSATTGLQLWKLGAGESREGKLEFSAEPKSSLL